MGGFTHPSLGNAPDEPTTPPNIPLSPPHTSGLVARLTRRSGAATRTAPVAMVAVGGGSGGPKRAYGHPRRVATRAAAAAARTAAAAAAALTTAVVVVWTTPPAMFGAAEAAKAAVGVVER